MEGLIGNLLVAAAFLSALGSMILYGLAAQREESTRLVKTADRLWILKGVFVAAVSSLLVYLIMNHRFEYFYVWNYTSLDLETLYLFSSLWGGQEGSFLVWIFMGFLVGLGLMRWTRKPYKKPVMFVMALSQVFLISMLLGWDLFGLKLGASPFRTIAQEMPNAPFIQVNPDFVPSDGTGLNDLLQSPWMAIHPPVIFLGFAMMTVPFSFAIASLWKKEYHDWIRPALPWTLGANLSLLTAIFLGGYWAYETLSFGGYWAWDPVENASLVPWLVGTAGIHMMIIQKKSSRAHKGAIFFAILAYVFIVYQTFLTRSGVLGEQSVHSFVDLGLYNQLLAFMLVIAGMGLGFYLYRYKELPSPKKESAILSREFMTFTGGLILFILGMVIILGTSSPIIGRLFVEHPTPPEIQFYNDWSMPIAIVMAFLTVIGQFLFWKKHDWESLASALITPLLLTSVAAILSIVLGDVRNLYYMIFIFAAWFTVIGNSAVMIDLARKKPALIGGALSHVGFGALLLGILASSAYNEVLLDQRMQNYNQMVEAGEVYDEQGFPVREKAETFMLELNQPKVIGNRYMATYEGYTLTDSPRPGQQQYRIRFEPLDGGRTFYMTPDVYPMQTTSTRDNIEWSVEPHVRTGLTSDIYLYVAGSAYVDQLNQQIRERSGRQTAGAGSGQARPSGQTAPDGQAASGGQTAPDNQIPTESPGTAGEPETGEESPVQTLKFLRGEPVEVGPYRFTFKDFRPVDERALPDSTLVAVRSLLEVYHAPSGSTWEVEPLFAVYTEDGQSYTYSPPLEIERFNLTVQFTSILPDDDSIEIRFSGLEEEYEEDWVVIVAEKKPFVSVVWLGTFLLMAGFSISLLRHWKREKETSVETDT